MEINHLETSSNDNFKGKKNVMLDDDCIELFASYNDTENKRFQASHQDTNFKVAESTSYLGIYSQNGDIANIPCKASTADFNMMLNANGKSTACKMEQMVCSDTFLDFEEIVYEEAIQAKNIFHYYDALISDSDNGHPRASCQGKNDDFGTLEATDKQYHFDRDVSSIFRKTYNNMELCTTLNSLSRMTGGSFTFGDEQDTPNDDQNSNDEYEVDLVIKINVDSHETGTKQNMSYSLQGTKQVEYNNYTSLNAGISVDNEEDSIFVPCLGSHESETWVAPLFHTPINSSLEENVSDSVEEEQNVSADNSLADKSCILEVTAWRKMMKNNEDNTVQNTSQISHGKPPIKNMRYQHKQAGKNNEDNLKYFNCNQPKKIRGKKTTMKESKKLNCCIEEIPTPKKHFFEQMKQSGLEVKTTTNTESKANKNLENSDDLWDELDEIFKSYESEGKSPCQAALNSLDQAQIEKARSSTLTTYDENASVHDFDFTFNQDRIIKSYEAYGKPCPSNSLDQTPRKKSRSFTQTNYENLVQDFDSTFNPQLANDATNQLLCNAMYADNGSFHPINTNENYFKENVQVENVTIPDITFDRDQKTFLNQVGSNLPEICFNATKKPKLEKNLPDTLSCIDYKDLTLDSTWESMFDRYDLKSLSSTDQTFADLEGQRQSPNSSTKHNFGWATVVENRDSPIIMVEDYNDMDFARPWDPVFCVLDPKAPSTRQEYTLMECQSQDSLASMENNFFFTTSIEKETKDSAPLMRDQNKQSAITKESKIARENDFALDSTWDSVLCKYGLSTSSSTSQNNTNLESQSRSSVIIKQGTYTGSTTSKEKEKNKSAKLMKDQAVEFDTINENHISLSDTWDSILGWQAQSTSTSGHIYADFKDSDFSSATAMDLVTTEDQNSDSTTVMENKSIHKNSIASNGKLNTWYDSSISSNTSRDNAFFKCQSQPLISSLQDNLGSNPTLKKESKDSDTVIKCLKVEAAKIRNGNNYEDCKILQKKSDLLNNFGCSDELYSSDSKKSCCSQSISLEETVTNNDVDDSVLKPEIGEAHNSENYQQLSFGSKIEGVKERNHYTFP